MSDNHDKPQYRIGSGDNQWLTPAEWSQVNGDLTAHQPSRLIDWSHVEPNTIHVVISDSTSPTAQPHLSAVWHWSALCRRQWRYLDLLLSRLLWKRKD